MGAYPALAIRPPEDNMEGIKTAFQLKAMLQNQQLTQQQAQLNQINIQKQQQAEHDRQALITLQKKHGNDIDKIIADAPAAGVSPEVTQGLQQHSLTLQKEAVAALQAKGAKALQDASLMRNSHSIVDSLPPEKKAQGWAMQFDQLQKAGVDLSGVTRDYPGDDNFHMLGYTIQAYEKKLEEQAKEEGIKKMQAETAKDVAETKKINMQTDAANPTDPDIQKAKYQKILQQIQTSGLGSINPQDYQWAKSFENSQKKTTTQSDSLGVSSVNTSGPSGLAAAGAGKGAGTGTSMPGASGAKPSAGAKPQSAKESIVDLVGQYKTDPALLSRMFIKHPEILGMVQQKYPDFDQTTYAAKNAFIKGLTSGHDSKALDAINTAMGHLKNLDDAVDALNNGNITMLNKIGRIYNVNVAGKTAEAAFKLIANRVGTEVTSAYVPGGGGEKERIANQEDFSADLPGQTLHNNAAITANMLRSKIGSMENRYKQVMGRDDFDKYITPEAKAALAKFGQRAAAGNAETKTYQGHTYVKGSDGQWHLQQ